MKIIKPENVRNDKSFGFQGKSTVFDFQDKSE